MTQQNIPENIPAVGLAQAVPEGYMLDSRGRLCPLSVVDPIDQMRDKVVLELFGLAKSLHQNIVDSKSRMFADIAAFVDLSAEQYGVKRGGVKGGVQLTSYDGRIKIVISKGRSIRADERILAAITLLNEFAVDLAKTGDENMQVVIQETFRPDAEGNLSLHRIMGLRRWKIKDPRWSSAMAAIDDSLQVEVSKQYIRFYERVGQTNHWKAVPLDVAAV